MTHVPFNRPMFGAKEHLYLSEAIGSGHISGDGPFTRRCHEFLEQNLGVCKALLTTSCTHALEMSALLLKLGPEDEVIVPSFTFVSTLNAFVLRGAKPIFCDIRPDTLNMDERLIEGLITPRTKAIVPVHYAGVGCEMDVLGQIAARHGIPIIEDNAHGLFGHYRGQPLGTFGQMATLSFHETKNLSCGEGGALLINDEELVARAEIIREKGTNRSRFFRGQVDKYSWIDVGSSYLPSDILSGILLAQMENSVAIQSARHQAWEFYADRLADWAHEVGVHLPQVPKHCDQAYHMFYLLLPSLEVRQALMAHLKERDIHTAFHYLPLHLSEMGRKLGGKAGDCPVTEDVSDRLLRLPFFGGISPEQQEVIAQGLEDFSRTHLVRRRRALPAAPRVRSP